jgi:hypothetical protein
MSQPQDDDFEALQYSSYVIDLDVESLGKIAGMVLGLSAGYVILERWDTGTHSLSGELLRVHQKKIMKFGLP